MQKKSNEERALWRGNCRQKLANHIYEKTGLTIKPEDVRLLTSSDDPYHWSYLPVSDHLFSKQLSKHNLRNYHEIYENVGVTFEAVLGAAEFRTHIATPSKATVATEEEDLYATPHIAKISFTSQVNHLKQQLTEMEARNIVFVKELSHERQEFEKQGKELAYLRNDYEKLRIDYMRVQSTSSLYRKLLGQYKSRSERSENVLQHMRKFLLKAESA